MPPPPPLEDEFLKRFVEGWEITGRVQMDDEVKACTTTESYERVLDHQFLLHHKGPMTTAKRKARAAEGEK